jgi:hypothetical protein
LTAPGNWLIAGDLAGVVKRRPYTHQLVERE